MADEADEGLAALVEAVLRGRKYARVLPALVERVGAEELAKRAGFAAALKATRKTLHRAIGSYYEPGAAHEAWLERLRGAPPSELRRVCADILRRHASTRERLPILDRFYAEVFAAVGPVARALDLACGVQPLALPTNANAAELEWLACDADLGLVELLNGFFPLAGLHARAFACDLTQSTPDAEVDVAFLLKSLPCLEQIDADVGARLLRELRAAQLVVSFPVTSLGGRRRGMPAHYGARFERLVRDTPWRTARRLEFSSELVFVLQR